MPPVQELIDLARVDLGTVVIGKERIYDVLPHRHEMALLDGIVLFDPERNIAIGYHDVRGDEFWVRGHIPGRPLMPGVLMVETAGQLCGFYFETVQRTSEDAADRFFGFAALEEVRFRGIVQPGQRFHVVASPRKMRDSSGVFVTQGFVDGRCVYEGTIKGMVIPTG